MQKWQKTAVDKYINYMEMANETSNIELRAIYVVKAAALHELLEDFDVDARIHYEEHLENKEN